jgi:predicted DNA-binding transcriptional regulator YafY
MTESIKNIICSAIKSKQLIQFNYDDGTRIVEPYCYGLSKNDKEILRAYQIKGDSKSGHPVGWKLFNASKMKNITISNEYFAIGHQYGTEPTIKKINCCI